MRHCTLRHQIELVLLVRDNRPGQGVSHTRELAKLNLKFVAVLSWAISLAAVLATANDYRASLSAWLYWQRIGWGYWAESWAADLRLMARALIAPWDWRGILYGA